MKGRTIISVGGDVGKLEPSYVVCWNVKWRATGEGIQ